MYKSYFWGYGGGHGHRTRRGDISPLILQLLQEKPMHGYEIISRLEEKSHGFWRPSAGAVYPNLQMLEEQEFVTSKDEDGKKVYSITDKGKQAAKETEEIHKAHWEEKDKYMKAFKEVKSTMFETMGLLRQIASEGSDEKNDEAKKILNETRDKLSKLAEGK
jgi:DNA-binding PadR family transcriptional regulator